MKKKILIVSASFYPDNSPRSFRTTELTKEFVRQGHKVALIIPKKNRIHEEFENKYGIVIKNLGTNLFSDIDLGSKKKPLFYFKRLLRRSLHLFFEYPNIGWMFKVKKALKNEKGHDLLISVAVPHPIHWGVALVWNKKKSIAKTWVADCGDPFMGATLDTFKKVFYFKYIEKWWCRKADFITVPFRGALDGYYKEFHEKIKVIPQGFNFNEIEIDSKKYIKNHIPTFAYAGGFIPEKRDPTQFLKYLVSLNKDFKFIIYTKSKSLILPYLEKAENKIELRNYIPRNELLSILSKMDFIINFNNANEVQLPSKLIDYYLTKRPVLSLNSTNFNKEIVLQFLNRDYKHKFMFENMDQYRIENICEQFLKLIVH